MKRSLPILLVLLWACLGFGPEDHRSLLECGRGLVSELGGSHSESEGPILDTLTVLSDKPASLVASLLVIGSLESRLTRGGPGAAGEVGTYQVLLSNVEWLSSRCGVVGNPEVTEVNARLAYCYLEHLYVQSGRDLDAAVAAYNAGPKAIRWVHTWGALPKVTANYLWRFKRLKERTACSKY